MAFSASEGKEFFRDWLVHFAKPQGIRTFLDVGCGAGLYGKIIRDVFGTEAKICGLDVFQEYIIRHNLKDIYDEILINDIRMIHGSVAPRDMIIAGDILEHLDKNDAIKVVNSLKKKCRFLWAALPVKMGRPWSTGYLQPDHEYKENPANKHLHDWTGEEINNEFKPLWLVPYVQTGVFLVEGENVGFGSMTKINDNLFIGNSSEAASIDELRRTGITAVFNVAKDLNDSFEGGLLTFKSGLVDAPCPENNMALSMAVMGLRRAIASGYVVLVHCHDGNDRAPFVVSMYLAEENSSDWKSEFEKIRLLRPTAIIKDWMMEATK